MSHDLVSLISKINIFPQAMNPDVYRGLWGGNNCRDSLSQTTRSCDCSQGNCNACDMYVEQFRDTIKFSVPKGKLAAFFVEPIQVLLSYTGTGM